MNAEDPRWQLALQLATGAPAQDPDGEPHARYGELGRNVLDKQAVLQAEIWFDIHGHPHALAQMSVEHRTNVIRMLEHQAEGWVIAAKLDAIFSAFAGQLPIQEAQEHLACLELLDGDWINQTPLVRELRRLNEAAPPQQPTPGTEVHPARLLPTDTGIWQITTETSIYVLDLDDLRVVYFPGTAAEPHIAPDGAFVGVTTYLRDYAWRDIALLNRCEVGSPLVCYAYRPDRSIEELTTTLVQEIRRLGGPPGGSPVHPHTA